MEKCPYPYSFETTTFIHDESIQHRNKEQWLRNQMFT